MLVTLRARETKDAASSMASVAAQSDDTVFCRLPATVSHSDHLQPIDIIIWAYVYCHRVDYTYYATSDKQRELDENGILWPVITVQRFCRDLHVRADTVEGSLNRLRAAGVLVTKRTSRGNRLILSERSTLDDTLHGENVRGWTFVPLDLLTSGLRAPEILVLVFLDRKQEGREYAWSSQEHIAQFIGRDLRTANRIIAKLKDRGRLEASPIPGEDKKIYQYKIFLRAPVRVGDASEETAPAKAVTEPVMLSERPTTAYSAQVDHAPEEESIKYVIDTWYILCGSPWVCYGDRPGLRDEIAEIITQAVERFGPDAVEKIMDDYSDNCREKNGRNPDKSEVIPLLKRHIVSGTGSPGDEEPEPAEEPEKAKPKAFKKTDQVPDVVDLTSPTSVADRLSGHFTRMAS
ncbi:hypothetical protein ACWDR9_02090 [Streptosporangium sandarakinum]